MLAGVDSGIRLLLLGSVLGILVWALSRLVARFQPSFQSAIQLPVTDVSEHTDAVLIIQPGGRVEYANALARQWFGLLENERPNLERLARRARPSDDFLQLCSAEGQARFSISGKLIEGVSYQVPGSHPVTLLSLRQPEITSGLSESGDVSGSVLRIITDFGQAIAENLNLEAALSAILENIERLIPADILEIKVWDQISETLIPYRFGSMDGKRFLEKSAKTRFGRYSEYLSDKRAPLLVSDTQNFAEIRFTEDTGQYPIRSYIGIPLQAGGELVGTLEVGQIAADAYASEDQDILQLVAGQAAVAIRNALLYENEQRRSVELSGLANLAQAAGSLQAPEDFFGGLVESITHLFDVKILGFLLYDENRRMLEGQVPFKGIPAHVVDVYRAEALANSPAAEIIATRAPLLTQEATEDKRWHDLNLHDVVQAASMHETALAPLVSGDRFLGYLQLSNHSQGKLDFSQNELHLMDVVANQAATIIDNAMLVQQTRQRARRSEAMRRIASLVASSATVDEILRFSMRELSQLLKADAAVVFLLDENQGMLQAHLGSVFGVPDETVEKFSRLYLDDPQFRSTVTGSQQTFLSGQLSRDKRVLPFYRPLVDASGMESSVVVPLIVRERSVGEMMIGSREVDFFTKYDLQSIITVAGQLAVALEESSVSAQTDETLRVRVEQLTTLSRVSRELNTTQDLKRLLQVVYDEGIRTTKADCGTITLFEQTETEGELNISLALGCSQADELTELEQTALEGGKPILVADVDNGEYPASHEGVRSALVVPIAYQGKTVGLLHLHSQVAKHFNDDTLGVAQALAIQAAIALGNARRYHDQVQRGELLRRRAETLSRLLETTNTFDLDQPLEEALGNIASGIQAATPFDTVLISLFEPETGMLRRLTGVGIPIETLEELKARKQPLASIQQLLKPEFQTGNIYYIPADQTPLVPADMHMVTFAGGESIDEPDAWNSEDFLLAPLIDQQENPLGLISLDKPRDGMRPDRATIESVEVFAAQASLIISSQARLSEAQERVEALSSGLERQQRLLSISQNDLPIMLHKDLEQTITIQNLDRRTYRVRASLQITETVGRQLDVTSALQALGREILTHLGMSAALVAENTLDGPHLLDVMGNVSRATNPEALFGQRNPLRACLQTGETMLITNLDENDEWRETPLLSGLHAKSFISLPIKVGGETVAAVLAVSREPMSDLTNEDKQVYYQIARQSSVILQNIDLLSSVRRRLREVNLLLDFSRTLSNLGPASIVEALLESSLRVIPAAHAGVLLLWDERQENLAPAAAQNYADSESMMRISYRFGEALPGKVFAERKSRSVDEVDFANDYKLSATHLLRYRQATGGRLPISSLLIPIQTGDYCLGVLVLDNFNKVASFDTEDETLLLSLSQQVALSLQNVRFAQATEERTREMEALTDVAARLTSSLESGELVASLLDQLGMVIPFNTATLWLHDKEQLTVASARGFSDEEERIGLTVAVEDSVLFKEMIRTGKGIAVADMREDERFPSLLDAEQLSWLGIPLISKGDVIGVIALEKEEVNFYDLAHVQVATTFAGQAAVALENARLYEDSVGRAAELDQRSRRLALLNSFSSELSGSLNEDQVLWLTAEELLRALNASQVSVIRFERGQAILKDILPETKRAQTTNLPLSLPDAPLFSRLRETLGMFTTENARGEDELVGLSDLLDETVALLALPLSSNEVLHTLFFIHNEGESRFSPNEIELARTIRNQASIALENARLYQSTLSTAERLAILNQVSAEISASLDPEKIYVAVHEAAKRLMPAESFVIALLNKEDKVIDGVYLVDQDERSPKQQLPLDTGLSGQVISTGKSLLVHGSEKMNEMGCVAFGKLGTPLSVLAVPMRIGEQVVGMLSAQSYQENVYSEDDQQILSTLANQAIIAIQNGSLFAETQNLTETLEQRVIERTAELEHEQHNTKTLLDILTEVSASLDLDLALKRTLALLNETVGAEQGTVMLLHPEDNLLHYRAGYGYLTEVKDEGKGFTLKVGEGLAGWVVKNREASLIDDLDKDDRWVHTEADIQRHHSAVAAPLMVGEDVIGVLLVFHRKKKFFNPEQLGLIKVIAGQVAVAINNANLYKLIREQAERLGNMLRSEQEEASRSQAILEAVADGVLVTDPENKISFMNVSAQTILDLDFGKVMGKTLEDFSGLFGKAVRVWRQTIDKWSENPAAYQAGDTYAEQLELEDGRVVLVHLAPVMLKGNYFLGTVSIFRDITHEVEVDRLKSEFVATVSHELRTPMTSIRGYVDVLLMGAAGALTENQTHFLDIIRSNTERLNVLVADLLDISRIESGRITLTPQPIELRDVAEDVIANVLRRSQDENKPMGLSLEVEPDLPRVYGDIDRVRQIVNNLVENAYHYTPENGRITVQLHAVNDGDDVQVDVRDNGVGIALENQAQVFERFYRGEDPLVLATPGTGLGLPIVRQLVEMHQGRIWVESTGKAGEGSSFSFTLPIYKTGK